MKKTLQRLGIVTVGLSLCLWSCKEQDGILVPQEVQAPQIISKGVISEKGRLSFESIDAFKETIEKLKVMTEKEREAWDKKIGFESMQEFYNSHNEGIIFKEENPIFKTKTGEKTYIPDISFSHILNSDAVVKIGNEVFKFTPDGNRLTVKSDDESLLNGDLKNSRIKSEKVLIRTRGELNREQNKNARPAWDWPVSAQPFDSDHAVLVIWSENSWFWFYTSWYMKLQMREYSGWWIFKSWGSGTAQHLELRNASMYISNWAAGNFGNVPASNSCDDCSETSVFLNSAWGPVIFSDALILHADYSGKWNNQVVNGSF
jgi:hypothetical protein